MKSKFIALKIFSNLSKDTSFPSTLIILALFVTPSQLSSPVFTVFSSVLQHSKFDSNRNDQREISGSLILLFPFARCPLIGLFKIQLNLALHYGRIGIARQKYNWNLLGMFAVISCAVQHGVCALLMLSCPACHLYVHFMTMCTYICMSLCVCLTMFTLITSSMLDCCCWAEILRSDFNCETQPSRGWRLMDLLIVDRRETIDKLNCLLMRPCKLYMHVCVCVWKLATSAAFRRL